MKYKIISFDFDGTLLNDDCKVSNITKEFLLSYKDKGYIIVGVTARNLASSKDVVDLNMLDYLIINNGSHIYDIKNNSEDKIEVINKNLALDIYDVVKESDCQFEFITNNYYYVYKEKRNSPVPFIKDIDDISDINEDISKINIFFNNENDLEAYVDLINTKFNEINCFVMRDSNASLNWITVNPRKINKLEALKLLGKQLNINHDKMIFFGDSVNDLEAIEGVGCGVAMGNALDIVKEKAKYITLSNNENGIISFLKKFLSD